MQNWIYWKFLRKASPVPLDTAHRKRFFYTSIVKSQLRNEPKLSSNEMVAYARVWLSPQPIEIQQKFTKWKKFKIQSLKCFHNAWFVNTLDEMYWNNMKISRWCGSLTYFHMLWRHLWELAVPFSKLSCHMELICCSNYRQIFNISDIITFSIFLLNKFSNFCH